MVSKKVLIVTYYWPPSGGVGVQRWLHFARNLKDLGWEPTIYTPSNPQFEIKDEKLISYVEDIPVITTEIWEPFDFFHRLTGGKERKNVSQGLVLEGSKQSWYSKLAIWARGNLLVPDPRVFWVRKSIRYLNSYLKTSDTSTLITSGPPHSMHLIGLGLKKKNKKLRWVADFRDPWSDWDLLEKLKTSGVALKRHRTLERRVISKSDLVITVSKTLAKALSGKSEDGNVKIVANGVEAKSVKDLLDKRDDNKFRIGYFGMLNELRNPEDFFKTLEEICSANEHFSERLELVIGGIVSGQIKSRLESSHQLAPKVSFLGYVDHAQVFAEYKKCNLLLLLQNQTENAKWILPVKFFEYLACEVPILALGKVKSDLGDLMSTQSMGKLFEYEEAEEIKLFIIQLSDDNFRIDPDQNKKLIEEYSRWNQTKILISHLEELVENG